MRKFIERLPSRWQSYLRSWVRAGIAARGFCAADSRRSSPSKKPAAPGAAGENPLSDYFQAHHKGHGIWKWEHYFSIYHRHLRKFVGTKCRLLEIGVFSGGSLQMWRDYLGSQCEIVGVDIEEACSAYESHSVKIHIGDQGSPKFWQELITAEQAFDIVIDDGSHRFSDQAATLEAVLPHVNPGGVYVCEDVHGEFNKMSDYLGGYLAHLNHWVPVPPGPADAFELASPASPLQRLVAGIHCYPYVVVLERCEQEPERFLSVRRGDVWQPFL